MTGAVFLLVVAVYRWPVPADELSYYIGARRLIDGVPLYDPTATAVTPYAYRYPPPLAQALVPVALVVSPAVFTALWTVLLMGCLYWLAGRDIWIMLAMIAFPPVAVELWFRNIHLVLAVLVVLGIRRWSGFYAMGAAIKLAPVLGIVYLAVRRRWRDAVVGLAVGVGILVVSFLLNPTAWAQFVEITMIRGPLDESGFVAVPYALRMLAGLAITIVAAIVPSRRLSGSLLVVAVTVALPTLWFTALSMLAALYLILADRGGGDLARAGTAGWFRPIGASSRVATASSERNTD
jgi:alpha-1,2-mannosyltransferase